MKNITKNYDVVVVGGGVAGMCAAIAAARHGAQTALVQNRPVLGGNASGEIRMHICGADHHNGRKNARETGIIEEIQLKNKARNPEYSYPIFDAVMWECANFEKNLDLYLNLHIDKAQTDCGKIISASGTQQTSERYYTFTAKPSLTQQATVCSVRFAVQNLCTAERTRRHIMSRTDSPKPITAQWAIRLCFRRAIWDTP